MKTRKNSEYRGPKMKCVKSDARVTNSNSIQAVPLRHFKSTFSFSIKLGSMRVSDAKNIPFPAIIRLLIYQ